MRLGCGATRMRCDWNAVPLIGGARAMVETEQPRALFIRASAGTGKTFRLSNRYLQLLIDGVVPESILASTFTRKAAGEILDRVVQRLARATRSETDAAELAGHLERPHLDRAKALEVLVELLRQLDRCRISTLDAFFGQIARTWCLELGLPTVWSIVDEADDVELRDEAIRRTLSEGHAREVVHLLAKGETQRSIGKLVGDTIGELYGFYLDAEPGAWERLPDIAPLTDEQLNELIRRMSELRFEKAGIENARQADLAAFVAGDWEATLGKGIGKKVAAGETTFNRSEIPSSLAEIYRSLLTHLAALRLAEQRSHLTGARRLLETFHEHYERLKRDARVMRFEDVTATLDRRWGQVAERGGGSRGEAALGHLLLDEFQDTSPIQWRVLRPQVERANEMADGSLMVVGDTKQAIYGWRGGDARLFDAVEKFAGSDGLTQTLDVSRRSSNVVLDAVNRIFEHARDRADWERDRIAVRRWIQGYVTHRSAYPELTGHVRFESAVDPFDRAVALAAELHAVAPSIDIALLVRGNDSVGDLIGRLTRAGVPASEEAGKSIADAPIVRIVLSALALTDHPDDGIARFHLAATPLGRAWGFVDEPEGADANARLAHRIAAERRAELIHDGYGRTIERWIEPLAATGDRRERQRLAQLVDLAFRFEPRATLRPSDFIRFVEREKVSDPSSAKVRVMNFHQSKGLEFDAVILPDIDRKWVGQTPRFVTHRPEVTARITAVVPYVRQADAGFVPKELADWTEEWRRQEFAESLSMCYVALTRAARALYPIMGERKNEGTLTYWSGLFSAALAPGTMPTDGVVLYEAGDPAWHQGKARRPGDEGARTRPAPPMAPIELRVGDPRLMREPARVSPSGTEGGFRIRVSDLLKQGSREALARGTAAHALFEEVIWNDAIPNRQRLARKLASLEETPSDVEGTIERFVALLAAPETGALFDRAAVIGSAAKVWPDLASLASAGRLSIEIANEYRFAYLEGDAQSTRIFSGSIDRLVVFRDETAPSSAPPLAAMIVDFKTDPIGADDRPGLAERTKHYAPQLEAYRSAVARLLRLAPERIACRLAFVAPDRVVSV
ncbi:MAG TPA: UvrD-helicase domain-containing protein [Pirellulaceae bacterium]|nr:UvrD-helicase domain-containing protein [Pirellulaceae bacterium]